MRTLVGSSPRRGLIINADDFGLHMDINQAVEKAYRFGVLNSTSLMVGEPAADDAVERARRLPGLAVGLHLALADGRAVLDRWQIPDLVDRQNRFGSDMLMDGIRFFFSPSVRRQLAAEIRAQFQAFAKTGLKLDHVNAHKHFHVHPTVLTLMLEIGFEFGMKAVRLPLEAGSPWWLRPWIYQMRWRLRRAGIVCNDHVVGVRRSGSMDEGALLEAIENLPEGVTEIYLHPGIRSGADIAPTMRGYRHRDELAALVSPLVRQAVMAHGGVRGGFAQVLGCGA